MWKAPGDVVISARQPQLVTRCLPFFDSVYRIDKHQDVEQETVPDPHDQHRLGQHEHRKRAGTRGVEWAASRAEAVGCTDEINDRTYPEVRR